MSEPRPKLAVCAIFKNEAPYLLEWIAYHRTVGVDHFVLYDNDSVDNGTALLRGSKFAEHVTVIHWPQRPGQITAYRHFIDIFAPGFAWAAFIDLDEFLLPLDSGSVVDTLDRLGDAAAVLVHRRVFGPGAWNERPAGLAIENYDQRAPDTFDMNRHVKPIVRCANLLDVTTNPHEFTVRGQVVNAAGQRLTNTEIQDSACLEHLVINHYHTRSRADWAAKIARGNAMFDQPENAYDPALIEHFAAVCTVPDRTIQRFAPQVRALLDMAGSTAAPPAQPAPSPAAAAPAPAPPPESTPVNGAPGWTWAGPHAQQHRAALVFQDMSRPSAAWIAAVRGGGNAAIDPGFVLDEFGRIRDFASDAEARAACTETLRRRGQFG